MGSMEGKNLIDQVNIPDVPYQEKNFDKISWEPDPYKKALEEQQYTVPPESRGQKVGEEFFFDFDGHQKAREALNEIFTESVVEDVGPEEKINSFDQMVVTEETEKPKKKWWKF